MEIKNYCTGEHYILCLCEGTAEEDIMNWLLDENRLLFTRKDLIDKKFIRTRIVKKIEDIYLSLDYDKPIVIMRIIDSKKEKFNLGNLYKGRFEVMNIITNPEIEILMIVNRGDLHSYATKQTREKLKPSEYAAKHYRIKKIKQSGTMKDFFNNDIDSLVHSIREHKSKKGKGHYTLADIIK